ncbi:MAG: HEAT repeat domain-containing protein [Myxococcota bacterium]
MSLFIPALTPNFDAALRDVTSDNVRARRAAALRLVEPPEGRAYEAREALLILADDKNAGIRELAVESLGFLGDAEALATILERIDDAAPNVREAAVIAATRFDDRRVDDALEAALESSRPEVRFQAIMSYAERASSADALERLSVFLEDEDSEIRAQTAMALGNSEPEAERERAVELLRPLLEDPEPNPRKEAALALANFGDGSGAAILRECLRDAERAIAAALALGKIRDKDSIPALAAIAQRPFASLHFRAAAGAALAELSDPRGVATLRKVLRAIRADGRGFAAELAAERGLTELLPDIAQLLDRPRGADAVVIVRAVAGLSETSEEARSVLQSAAERTDEVGEAARELLEE